MIDNNYFALVRKASEGYSINKEEIIKLLEPKNIKEEQYLFSMADKLCTTVFGKAVLLRGIIEFSNYCSKKCMYCGLRADNKVISRYRLLTHEIVEAAQKAIDLGCPTIVLQSGEDDEFSLEQLLSVIRIIKKYNHNVAVTVSVGLRSFKDYSAMRNAGADRYLMKQETACAELFRKMRPDTTLEERITGLRHLHDLGFEIGSGMMVGLPGQTLSILAEDILLLVGLNVEMAGIGPFVAHHETPFKSASNGSVDLTLRAIAITRLLMPNVNLPATTALGTLDKEGRKKALQCGANVIMPNVSPQATRELYSIYSGKMGIADDAEDSYKMAIDIIKAVGKVPQTI